MSISVMKPLISIEKINILVKIGDLEFEITTLLRFYSTAAPERESVNLPKKKLYTGCIFY